MLWFLFVFFMNAFHYFWNEFDKCVCFFPLLYCVQLMLQINHKSFISVNFPNICSCIVDIFVTFIKSFGFSSVKKLHLSKNSDVKKNSHLLVAIKQRLQSFNTI